MSLKIRNFRYQRSTIQLIYFNRQEESLIFIFFNNIEPWNGIYIGFSFIHIDSYRHEIQLNKQPHFINSFSCLHTTIKTTSNDLINPRCQRSLSYWAVCILLSIQKLARAHFRSHFLYSHCLFALIDEPKYMKQS